ncbi:MAG: Ig-like domain-containing protein [Gemmatimonadaceae bacterium]
MSVGSTIPLQAQAQDASGQLVRDVSILWASSDTTLAAVSSIGVVTARAVGTVQIAASAGGKSAVATLAIVPVPVASVTVLPGQGTVSIGGSLPLSAVAYSDAGAVLTGREVLWATSAPQVATVDAGGNVKGVTSGTVTITATSEGKSGAATIAVSAAPVTPTPTPTSPAPVATVSVLPGSLSLTTGQTASVSALALDADQKVLSGRAVTWSSANSAVATVDGSGSVRAVGAGNTTITATSEGKAGTAQVVVTAPAAVPVASVAVNPSTGNIVVGGTLMLSATTRDASGATISGRSVAWSTTAPQIATVSSSGVVTAISPGNVTITAGSEGKIGSASITVQAPAPPAPAPVASVAVSPSSGTIAVGGTLALSATVRDASGNTLSGRTVTWSSSTPQVATVSSSGVVTAVAPGSATITATSEERSGSAAINVPAPAPAPASVATIVITPSTNAIRTNGSVLLTAQLRDANGNVLTGRAVEWSVSGGGNSVLSVASNGSSTALATSKGKTGSATVIAASEGKQGTAVVIVSQ